MGFPNPSCLTETLFSLATSRKPCFKDKAQPSSSVHHTTPDRWPNRSDKQRLISIPSLFYQWPPDLVVSLPSPCGTMVQHIPSFSHRHSTLHDALRPSTTIHFGFAPYPTLRDLRDHRDRAPPPTHRHLTRIEEASPVRTPTHAGQHWLTLLGHVLQCRQMGLAPSPTVSTTIRGTSRFT